MSVSEVSPGATPVTSVPKQTQQKEELEFNIIKKEAEEDQKPADILERYTGKANKIDIMA